MPGRRFPLLNEQNIQQCKVPVRACSCVRTAKSKSRLKIDFMNLWQCLKTALHNCSPSHLTELELYFIQRRMGKNSLSSMCKAGRDPPQSAFSCNCSKTWYRINSSVQIHVTLFFHFIYLFF